MKKLSYYVACTADGFICDLEGGVEGFSQDPELVEHYQKGLQEFGYTIMGKKTYEFGYQFGLKAGSKAYPHMEHFVYSRSIELPEDSEVTAVRENWEDHILNLKENAKSDIYLCGGSQFAGFVWDLGLIDELILKVNPMCLGKGQSLFDSLKKRNLKTEASKVFGCGVVETKYQVLKD